MTRPTACRIVAWGAYDESKPRVRLLLGEIRKRGVLTAEINMAVWNSVRDKAVASPARILAVIGRLLASYPGAILKLLRQPPGSAILLPYPAIPDIFFAWPVARLRRHMIIFDAFIPLHDTLAGDRALVRKEGLAATMLWRIERAALRLADIILVDTDPHGDFYAREFGIPSERFQTILVGAEPPFWSRSASTADLPAGIPQSPGRPIVLFYGQLSPLHGLDAIVDAIRKTEGQDLHWLLIGSGQEEEKLERLLGDFGGDHVTWLPWVDYDRLPAIIRASAVGLGVFGSSDKAGRVIPNKVFQIMAAGKPVITRAGPAMDPIAARFPKAVVTVPPEDGAALADAVKAALECLSTLGTIPTSAQAQLGPAAGIKGLLSSLGNAKNETALS